MEKEFGRVIVAIMISGTAIIAIGSTLLFLAFRAFGTAKRGDIRHVALVVATLAFVLICCAGLLIWALR